MSQVGFDRAFPTGPKPPGVLSAAQTVPLIFRASVTEMRRRKIFVFLGLVCSIPLLLTLIWRVWGVDHLDAQTFFTNMVSSLYLQLLVYVVAMAFGIPAVHSEIQGRTITYLFTRPINKAHVYAGRLLAVQLTAGVLLALSLVGCFVVMVFGNFGVLDLEFIKAYLNHVLLVLVATVCLSAVCAIFGTAFRRPVIWALLYAFGWELIVSKFPGTLQTYTVNFHIRNLLLDDADVQATLMDAFRMLLTSDSEVSATASVLSLVGVVVVATAVGGWLFARREYVIS